MITFFLPLEQTYYPREITRNMPHDYLNCPEYWEIYTDYSKERLYQNEGGIAERSAGETY